LLLCAWQSQTVSDAAIFAAAGHINTTPVADGAGGLDIAGWLQQQGLAAHQFIALPHTHQMLMPQILRECDAALFPNRCEGGTNLVAMEAMACGVPSLIADNSGQHDLVALAGALPLTTQMACIQFNDPRATTTGWGESDVEECVAGLEQIYQDHSTARAAARSVATTMQGWNWHSQV
jgi:glycosyltransferase involved in cell wall biosynthesis